MKTSHGVLQGYDGVAAVDVGGINNIFETATGERQEIRQAHIKLSLLGAYHDGHIEIEYINVLRYSMGSAYENHGDWEYDEIRLSEAGKVLLEIEIGGFNWVIECKAIRYSWLPTA